MKKIVFPILTAVLLIVGCSTQTSTKEVVHAKSKVVEQEDIEIKDPKYKEAAEEVKAFLTAIYTNKDFSQELKGSELLGLKDDPDLVGEIWSELKYITDDGKNPQEVKKVIIQEIKDAPIIIDDTTVYDSAVLVNSKVIHKSGKESLSGNIVIHNTKLNRWELSWYNLQQHIAEGKWVNGNQRFYIKPANEEEKEAIELAEVLTKGFYDFGNRKDINDTAGLVELWYKNGQENFKKDLINSNATFLKGTRKEKLPLVASVSTGEIQKFKKSPVDGATAAYTVYVHVEYVKDHSIEGQDDMGVVVVKVDNSWKVYQITPDRVTPWTFEDDLKQE